MKKRKKINGDQELPLMADGVQIEDSEQQADGVEIQNPVQQIDEVQDPSMQIDADMPHRDEIPKAEAVASSQIEARQRQYFMPVEEVWSEKDAAEDHSNKKFQENLSEEDEFPQGIVPLNDGDKISRFKDVGVTAVAATTEANFVVETLVPENAAAETWAAEWQGLEKEAGESMPMLHLVDGVAQDDPEQFIEVAQISEIGSSLDARILEESQMKDRSLIDPGGPEESIICKPYFLTNAATDSVNAETERNKFLMVLTSSSEQIRV